MRLIRPLLYIGLAVLILGTVAWHWFNGIAKKSWLDYRAAWEANGEEFDWNAFIPPEVPDDENFAQVFTEFVVNEDGLGQFRQLRAADRSERRGWRTGCPIELDDWVKVKPRRRDEPLTLQQIAALTDRHQDELDAIAEAARRPHCRFELNYNQGLFLLDSEPMLQVRDAAYAFRTRGLLALKQGDIERAADDCETAWLIVEHAQPMPALLGHLVGVTLAELAQEILWEGLRTRQWSDAQLQRFDAVLSRIDFEGGFLTALREERAGFVDFLQRGIDGSLDMTNEFQTKLAAIAPQKGLLYRNMHFYCELMENYLVVDGQPAQRIPSGGGARYEAELMRLREWNHIPPLHKAIASVAALMLSKAEIATLFAANGIAMARVGIALERYRIENGAYPDSLDALTPRWIEPIPRDRHQGQGDQRIHYEIKEDGTPRLYAVGVNGIDDGGEIYRDLKEGDWVWQYTNPDFDPEKYHRDSR